MNLQQIITGNCLEVLPTLEEGSVQVCCTSPPYFGVRHYGTEPVEWEDGWCGELGQEPVSDLFVSHLVQVFREARRTLHKTGLLFLNLADSRSGSGKGRGKDRTHSARCGDKQRTNVGTLVGELSATNSTERAPRSPLGIPDRVKEALVADGWILVSAICLWKKNPMTSPARGPRWVNCYKKVKTSTLEGSGKQAEVGGTYAGFNERYRGEDDAVWMRCPGCKKCEPNGGRILKKGGGRPTDAYEMLYVLAKSQDYFYNTEAVRKETGGNCLNHLQWIPKPTSDRHYACFPPFLPTFCLNAGCPEWCCAKCGTPYAPVIDGDTHDEEAPEDREWQKACGGDDEGEYHGEAQKDYEENGAQNASDVKRRILAGMKKRTVVDWWPICKCETAHSFPEVTTQEDYTENCRCVHCGVRHVNWLLDIEGEHERCRRKPVVLDPFVGSGTTLVVAKQKGLPAVGIDAQPNYEPIAAGRLERAEKVAA